ncbi:MAG: ketosteroid isomerase [Alphaproteobacteria bacterium HGW-Alphaproteobacteria-11]|nr:MAG: ketosteroid isomerase [Alphaproteobacteria bacterium HGW-Alphaproteobacteria-11]
MADDALVVAERFFRAVETGDTEEVSRIYAPDARVWHNFSQAEQSVEENLKVLRWMARKLPGRRYDVLRRVVIPGGFMQQHVVRGALADGSNFAMPACVICLVEDGRISRLEEYLDPAQAAVLSA